MSINRRSMLGLAAACIGAAALGVSSFAHAAGYPDKPVTVYIGFSAGGPTDTVGRLLADKLSQKLGQTFVVENKVGASGVVAANLVQKAKPDGYTLMLGSSSTLSIIPHVQKNIQYDAINDFTPVALVASYPYYLAVPADSPFKTLDDLIAYGRDKNNELSYASAGTGAVNHLAGEWLKEETGIKALHVPYKGDSAAMPDLIAGRVDYALLAGIVALPQVEAGKLRVLASASSSPDKGAPNIEIIGQKTAPGFDAEPWNGLMGPAGMPEDVVSTLNTAVNEVLSDPEVKARLLTLDQYPFTSTPAQFKQHIKDQSSRWAGIIKSANIVIE
ncbi:tripartite tricarboxylate transporter substrate binding protein [Pusillimonas sp. MFBS29]|uniref:Bug family tripartite tricarboxylate transporter substrate binding protein n=1 Tax=Pusillimonas sp. MFBS29 TaxID=2886690 RepID=UPI001D10A62A|nr:tripartite tricarboxylate transporter substrate binding protein [Pusillimonas sp. MFBS29]MCC2595839.1 tripartite tricarboxylate transporter substrate binding protein [Pusillimonas sp. MFBS29]